MYNDLFEYVKNDETSFKKSINEPERKAVEKPVITKRYKRSSKALFPYSQKELEGYHFNGDSNSILFVTGKVESLNLINGEITIRDMLSEKIKITVGKNTSLYEKALYLEPGDKITSVVNEKKICQDLKYGPFFGSLKWTLFYKEKKRAATEFEIIS